MVARQLPQQLEARAILEALAGDDDIEVVDTHQIEAVSFIRDSVDSEILTQRLSDLREER
jgi:hypothetical protein